MTDTGYAALARPSDAPLVQSVFQMAENNIPVALVQVGRTSSYAMIYLQPQEAQLGVCWWSSGANAPYLLASGKRYRLIQGYDIASCPTVRDYAPHQMMQLEFEPLPPEIHEFSLIEGQLGENQMNHTASPADGEPWNFLHVKLN